MGFWKILETVKDEIFGFWKKFGKCQGWGLLPSAYGQNVKLVYYFHCRKKKFLLIKTTHTVVFAALNEYLWGMGQTGGRKEGSKRAALTWIEKYWRSSSLLSFINDKMKMLCSWILPWPTTDYSTWGRFLCQDFVQKLYIPVTAQWNRLIVDTAYIDTYTRDHCYSQVIGQWTHTPIGNLLRMETMISTNSWPKLVFEPGEEFDNRLNINLGDLSMYTWALIIAGTFTLFALCLSSHLLRSHLSSYNNPNVRFSPSFQPM